MKTTAEKKATIPALFARAVVRVHSSLTVHAQWMELSCTRRCVQKKNGSTFLRAEQVSQTSAQYLTKYVYAMLHRWNSVWNVERERRAGMASGTANNESCSRSEHGPCMFKRERCTSSSAHLNNSHGRALKPAQQPESPLRTPFRSPFRLRV